MGYISLSNVYKTYRVGNNIITALSDVSLQIERGEFIVILGPSGSGKTTLLNILGGLEKPDSGDVIVADKRVSALPERQLTYYRRQNVGFVFQFFNLLPTLTALENVGLAAEMSQDKHYDPAQMLARVGLQDRMDHYPGQLSGGQQQRVAIARALVKNPALILTDEPTGSLDVQTGVDVLTVIRELNKETGQTFVVVTHNAAIAKIADRVVQMSSGTIHDVMPNPHPLNPAQVNW